MSVCGTVRWENARRDKIPSPWKPHAVSYRCQRGSRGVCVLPTRVLTVSVGAWFTFRTRGYADRRGVSSRRILYGRIPPQPASRSVGPPSSPFSSRAVVRRNWLSVSNPECCLLSRASERASERTSCADLRNSLAERDLTPPAGKKLFSIPSAGGEDVENGETPRESHVNAGKILPWSLRGILSLHVLPSLRKDVTSAGVPRGGRTVHLRRSDKVAFRSTTGHSHDTVFYKWPISRYRNYILLFRARSCLARRLQGLHATVCLKPVIRGQLPVSLSTRRRCVRGFCLFL